MSKRILSLQNRRAALVKEMEAMLATADGDGRDLNEEETKTYQGHEDELKDVASRLAREDRLAAIERGMPSAYTPPDQAADGGAQPEPEEPEGFESFGQMLQAVAHAGSGTGPIDRRLLAPSAAVSGLSEGVAADGGFLVGTDISNELLRQTYETGQLAQRCSRTSISGTSNGLKINGINETSRAAGSQWGGVTAYWLNEAGTKTDSKPAFRQVVLNLNKLIGLCYATDELLQDAAALESIIMEAFPNVFAFYVDEAIIAGTGAGQPKGILATGPKVRVSKETGQAATTIIAENIEKMYARMWSRGLGNAAWFINQDCWPQIFKLHHVVGTGGVPMFIPSGGLTQAPSGTLLGRPIVPVEQARTLGTEGDIIFGDFSQYKLIDKGGIQSDSSIHVRFVYDETCFRFVLRIDGQPMWATALTPAQGTNTVSPFITLQTRS